MLPYLGVFLATAGTVFLITPLVRRVSVRVGAIDQPSPRKIHPTPTPTLGGLGMLVGLCVGLVVAYLTPEFRGLFRFSEIQGVLIAAVVIVVIGAIDDVRTLSAPAKVAGQVLTAGILILNGVVLVFFYLPTQGTISLGSDLAVPLTIAWVLLVVNAVNLIDGLDGLAAGIVAIAAASFFVYAYNVPSSFADSAATAPLLSAIACGAAIGFLPWNFYPARIIMGDTGAMLLGVLLAAATITGVGHTAQTIGPTGHDLAAFTIPVLIPVLVILVPLLDVVLAVARRLVRHRPWYTPDKEHIHHQLMEIGHTHRQAVLLMYLWSAVIAGSALAMSFARNGATVAAVAGFAVLVIAVTIVPKVWMFARDARRQRAAAKAPATATPAADSGTPAAGAAAGGAVSPD